ncbi:MAG: hypothetical protein ACK4V1_11910 [Burkholderiaceae bacterium]
MAIELFLPLPRFVPALSRARALTLREVCERAGVPCRASGAWTQRPIRILARGNGLSVVAEPGSWGAVQIEVPRGTSERTAARLALGILAYGLLDRVARESIRGAPWAKPPAPRGRPRTGTALNVRERQRRLRARARPLERRARRQRLAARQN